MRHHVACARTGETLLCVLFDIGYHGTQSIRPNLRCYLRLKDVSAKRDILRGGDAVDCTEQGLASIIKQNVLTERKKLHAPLRPVRLNLPFGNHIPTEFSLDYALYDNVTAYGALVMVAAKSAICLLLIRTPMPQS